MEKTTLKHVSKEFGMKANEFAKAIGYTPQAFNTALRTGEIAFTRMSKAMDDLKDISDKMYLKQINEANNAKSRREQVLASLAKWFGMSWD